VNAFPYQEILPDGMANLTPQRGMTLRDYFAAKAMQGMVTDKSWQGQTCKTVANISYEMADAMLKARGQ